MNDEEFRRAFLERRLQAFHHRDHVRLAWTYLREDSSLRGLDRFVHELRRFALDAGKPELYHETLTWGFLLLVRERMALGPEADFESFAGANADLMSWKPSVLERYYRPETLASPRARQTFVMPDRGLPIQC